MKMVYSHIEISHPFFPCISCLHISHNATSRFNLRRLCTEIISGYGGFWKPSELCVSYNHSLHKTFLTETSSFKLTFLSYSSLMACFYDGWPFRHVLTQHRSQLIGANKWACNRHLPIITTNALKWVLTWYSTRQRENRRSVCSPIITITEGCFVPRGSQWRLNGVIIARVITEQSYDVNSCRLNY